MTTVVSLKITATTRTDGSPLPAASVQSYKLYRGNAQGGPFDLLGAQASDTFTEGVSFNTYWYRGTVVDTNGQESAPSLAVNPQVQAAPPPPAPPAPPATPTIGMTYTVS